MLGADHEERSHACALTKRLFCTRNPDEANSKIPPINTHFSKNASSFSAITEESTPFVMPSPNFCLSRTRRHRYQVHRRRRGTRDLDRRPDVNLASSRQRVQAFISRSRLPRVSPHFPRLRSLFPGVGRRYEIGDLLTLSQTSLNATVRQVRLLNVEMGAVNVRYRRARENDRRSFRHTLSLRYRVLCSMRHLYAKAALERAEFLDWLYEAAECQMGHRVAPDLH